MIHSYSSRNGTSEITIQNEKKPAIPDVVTSLFPASSVMASPTSDHLMNPFGTNAFLLPAFFLFHMPTL